jgi:5,10-methylenetetrahydrofolate reductase
MELREMEEMVKAGAKYFLTTPVFDVDEFARFVKRVQPLGIPIIAELMMLHSGMQARMLKRISGMKIPERYVRRMEKAPVKFDESAKIMLEMIKELKDICSGVHVLAFGWESKIGRIIQDIRR